MWGVYSPTQEYGMIQKMLYLHDMTRTMPNLYIIAGCNGAGKTTASYTVLPGILNCKEFVNADEIARGLSPFNLEGVAIEAGRLMLARMEELLNGGVDFAFETTLATRSYASFVKRAQAKGYYVSLVYFWLESPELAIDRVKMRVAAGGHNIQEEVIRRRYSSGIKNLFRLYTPICDFWIMLDNSQSPFKIIANGNKNDVLEVIDSSLYNTLESHE
jgi:predicted ABC-type ATPase